MQLQNITNGSDHSALESEYSKQKFNFNVSYSVSERENLPIRKHRNELLYCLEKYQVTILVGESGCGKSTQVPQVSQQMPPALAAYRKAILA